MGLGDVLMTMGEGAELHKQSGKRVVMPRDSFKFIWQNINYLISKNEVLQDEQVEYLTDPFPATDLKNTTNEKIAFRKYKPKPAELIIPKQISELLPQIKKQIGRFIFIEPHSKTTTSSNNRDWGFEKYQKVVNELDFNFVQPNYGKPLLKNVIPFDSPTIFHAAGILSIADAGLCSEGGLMHLAAAVRTRCVVIFGGYISPETTGYDMHRNIFSADYACGTKNSPCSHCREALEKISVRQVISELTSLMQ